MSDNLVLVSVEEVLQARQIRFSLPSDEQQDENLTSEDIILSSDMR
jgi:hypothetical protein